MWLDIKSPKDPLFYFSIATEDGSIATQIRIQFFYRLYGQDLGICFFDISANLLLMPTNDRKVNQETWFTSC